MRNNITNTEQKIINTIVDKRLFTRKDIANHLNIKENTIATHLLHLYNKLNKSSMIELAFYELEKRGIL